MEWILSGILPGSQGTPAMLGFVSRQASGQAKPSRILFFVKQALPARCITPWGPGAFGPLVSLEGLTASLPLGANKRASGFTDTLAWVHYC